MTSFWIEIASDKDWVEFKSVLVRAFADDPWFVKCYPEKEERLEFVKNDFQHRYDVGIRDVGGFAVLKTATTTGDKIIGGICMMCGAFEGRGPLDWDKERPDDKRRFINRKLIFEPMHELANKFGTEMWFSTLQGVEPSMQRQGIGSEVMLKATYMIVEDLMRKKKMKKHPLVFGLAIHNFTAKFNDIAGWTTVAPMNYYLKDCGKLSQKIFILHFPSINDDIIKEARKLFNHEVSKL